jgi:4-hydroxy-tetrahydrodipicolinate reductase
VKIGLLGYGKMGKAIEKVALSEAHEIVWRINRENKLSLSPTLLKMADVVIEFSQPESGFQNVMYCLESGVPVVCGTTGWQTHYPLAKEYCEEYKGAMICASNFSIGVNIFFAVNQYLAKLMANRSEYEIKITETHHIHKLDAPSGTAVTLAESIINTNKNKKNWSLSPTPNAYEISINSLREGEVPGTHVVNWQSNIDEIVLEHKAHTREGFAKGAVLAATWLVGKTGVFEMKNVLGID